MMPISDLFHTHSMMLEIHGYFWRNGSFISLNYLNCPGVTDSEKEAEALMSFSFQSSVNFIQWRNLNFDPQRYYQMMKNIDDGGLPIGMDKVVAMVRENSRMWVTVISILQKERFKEIAATKRK